MTLFLNLRQKNVGGDVVDPYVLRGVGMTSPPQVSAVAWAELPSLVAGKNVVFATHGFNVSYEHGACSIAQVEQQLGLGDSDVFIGILWPGDWWLPIVNYPFEGNVAIECGKRVAAFCETWFAGAASFSFFSHSLGARVILEAVERLSRPAQTVVVTAGAVNRDCLTGEYDAARQNSVRMGVLASHSDWVLRLAFRIADPISDALHDDHNPFQPALGYDGPPAAVAPLNPPWQIADSAGYGHGDYMPPGNGVDNPAAQPPPKWVNAADFYAGMLRGVPPAWP